MPTSKPAGEFNLAEPVVVVLKGGRGACLAPRPGISDG